MASKDLYETRLVVNAAYRAVDRTPHSLAEYRLMLTGVRVGYLKGYSAGFAEGMARAAELAKERRRPQ